MSSAAPEGDVFGVRAIFNTPCTHRSSERACVQARLGAGAAERVHPNADVHTARGSCADGNGGGVRAEELAARNTGIDERKVAVLAHRRVPEL